MARYSSLTAADRRASYANPAGHVCPTPAGLLLREAASVIRVHVVHDHPVVRDALRLSLGCEPDLAVVGVSPDGAAGADAAGRSRSDVIVLTPSWREPPALWVARYRAVAPAAKVVPLQPASGEGGSEAAGADAAVLVCGLEELVEAIRSVVRPRRDPAMAVEAGGAG